MLLIRMRPSRLSAVLTAAYSALCAGQTTAHYNVTGTVVNFATGEPVRRALVGVGALLVFTGADGRFQAENVPTGQTMVSAQKPGFFDCSAMGCGANSSQATKTITVGSGGNDVLLKLVPESKIEGRIVDEDGEPVSNIQVTAMAEHMVNGLKQYRADGSANTNEDGHYRIERLMPGSYLIRTMARPAFLYQIPGFGELPPQMYPQRFYPNTLDKSAAQAVDLNAGQVADADFTLTPVSAFRISGSIAPSVPGISVNAEDADGEETNVQMRFDPRSGNFSLPFVPAGTWALNFEYDAGGHPYYATETVTVGSSDVKGLRILLQPLASVPVNLVNGSTEVQGIQVQLTPRGKSGSGRRFGTNSVPSGIPGVPPGSYRALVSGLNNQCLDSLTSGNVDLTREDLTVAPGSQPQPINVTLRDDCAALQVAVRSENQAVKPTVILIPASRAMEPISMQLDPAGSYTFVNLSPGEYQVFAFSSINGLEYANPGAMREFSGQQMTLTPNQRASVTLDVIAREDK